MPLSTGESESIGSIGGYVLVDRLGSGGMGVVHLARSASGRQVAVKVVHAQYALDEEFRARFRQEVAAARRVSGAFTAPVVDADPDAPVPWMATLYVPGRTLAELVAQEGPLNGPDLRALALGLVEALRDIHQAGVVHRDLKPSNVLMAADGPRVIDFGISRAADNQALTVTGRLIGTPPFMSPEQFVSPRDVTAASDVFSLGSLLVYAATGNRPFVGGSPYLTGYQVMYEEPHLDGVHEPLRSIAERCLEKDPADRPELTELHRLFRSLPDTVDAGSDAAAPPRGEAAPELARRAAGGSLGPNPARSFADTQGAAGSSARAAAARRRRTRRLLVLGVALAVTMVGAAAFYLSSNPGSGEEAELRTGVYPAPVLPAGWEPWRANLTRAELSADYVVSNAESGCLPGGSFVYCAGTAFTVAKIDAASGHVEWRAGVSPQTALPVGVRDGVVLVYEKPDPEVVVTESWRLVALDAGTGRRLWAHPVSEVDPAVLFSRGVLTMSDDRTEFIAFDIRTGKALWRTPAKSSAGDFCVPVALGGVPYGQCGQEDPAFGPMALVRLAPADGTARELASLPVGSVPLGVVDGRPLFAVPRSVEYESVDGLDEAYTVLLRVDPADGAVTRVPLAGTPRGSVTLAGGVAHFVRPDGTVTAVRVSDGARLWQRATGIENLSKPVVSSKYDALYLANRYGRLLALDRRTGAEVWSTDKLDDPGISAESTVPRVLLVKDAIVAVAGDTAFSVRPDRSASSPLPMPAPN
ncbi:PQQ-binding-like beta-propeller repeat protein [Streptomyces sp. NPDC088747]|uniref:serine/threonine-protein kinase n=1 Tax=Streptomyces sp. NPDC088747 TaxID=3365886 RepID=UPI00382DF964